MITVRQATSAVVGQIFRFARDLYEATKLERYGDFGEQWVAELSHFLIVNEQNALVLLAEDGEDPLGAAIVTLCPYPFGPSSYANEWLFWVEPKARKSGVASALLAAVEAWAKSKGARHVMLSEMAGEAGMESFCNALGFEKFQTMFAREVL